MTPHSSADLLDKAEDAARFLHGKSDAIEKNRRVPDEIARHLARQGLYRLLTPAQYGGFETSVETYLRVVERLAMADAAVAWCVFVGNTSTLVGAYLRADEAQRLFADPDLIMAGVFAPRGTAKAAVQDGVDGYQVSGRWSWGSGAHNAQFISGGCLVMGNDGKPEALPDGTPIVRSMVFPMAQVTLHDTWHVAGLCGTGSGDFEVRDVFVPRQRSLSLMADMPLKRPLYQFPVFGLLGIGIAGVALGIARVALDSLLDLAGRKTPQGSAKPLAQRPATQQEVARAEATLRSARSYLFEVIAAAQQDAAGGNAIPVERRRDIRLATTHATHAAAGVVQRMYLLAGGSAVFLSSPLQRCLRDVNVATQHMMVSEATFELAGRVFLGLPTNAAML
jgi:alkylation response protein AidB-like acyl-CoA dehydrogenase